MEVRQATDADIPEIVALLRLSLGESLMPKSELFWRWKHIDNPFGRSPVLLAFEEDLLIGVRAFMRWEWRLAHKIYRAVRAVDTATHPDYQGRGIFKKLTLQLVDQCINEGVDFIYNTPNKNSKPGYLKMGWKEMGRIPILIRPSLNFGRKHPEFDNDYQIDSARIAVWFRDFNFVFPEDNLITNYTSTFPTWRYCQNPTIPYFAFNGPSMTYLAFFRLKASSVGVEFRICDLFRGPGFNASSFRKDLFHVAGKSGGSLITFAGSSLAATSFCFRVGPVVTVRPLSALYSLSFDSWKPSLGDMEVF